ncbi:hypothetical protein PoB_007237300 [Plakobranchus ocellatus]|uniref:G-protein coupled receptors family 1 profile domain-containing protein n=1 Tax=Plakobranchus ocellatus TaxID=259542 RepID=A0AAV4DNI6_9GAST|nr:hypothetical protein PoB_007237300 [Plakobranchus ocellatus]
MFMILLSPAAKAPRKSDTPTTSSTSSRAKPKRYDAGKPAAKQMVSVYFKTPIMAKGGVGGTVDSEFTLVSAGALLSLVRALAPASEPDGGPETSTSENIHPLLKNEFVHSFGHQSDQINGDLVECCSSLLLLEGIALLHNPDYLLRPYLLDSLTTVQGRRFDACVNGTLYLCPTANHVYAKRILPMDWLHFLIILIFGTAAIDVFICVVSFIASGQPRKKILFSYPLACCVSAGASGYTGEQVLAIRDGQCVSQNSSWGINSKTCFPEMFNSIYQEYGRVTLILLLSLIALQSLQTIFTIFVLIKPGEQKRESSKSKTDALSRRLTVRIMED